MSILTYPSNVIPNSMSINLVSNAKVFISPLSGASRTHKFPGAMWKLDINLDTLDNNTVRELDIMKTFIWQLGGMSGRFYMWDFSKPGGPAKGEPKVQGVDQSGSLLVTDGWNPDRLVLSMGDYIEVNGELKIITEDIVSNSGGGATLKFMPELRNSPPDNADITTDKPKAIFRLVDNNQGNFEVNPGQHASVSISAIEVF